MRVRKARWMMAMFLVFGVFVIGGSCPGVHATTIRVIDVCEPHGIAMQKLAPIYEKETGIKVEVDVFGWDATLEKEMLLFMSQGSDYDVVAHDCVFSATFQRNGWLLDLRKYLEDPSLPNIDLTGYLPGLMEAYDIGENGEIWDIPIDLTGIIMVYIPEMFEEAGMAEPAKTWDEYLEQVKRMTKDLNGDGIIDQYGIVIHPGAPDPCYTDWIVRVTGFDLPPGAVEFVLNKECTETIFDRYPYGVKALEMLKDILQYSPFGSIGYGYGEVMEAFRVGLAASWISWQVNMCEFLDPLKSKVAGKVAFALSPITKERHDHIGGWRFGINKYSKHPEEAYKFMAWIASKEGVEKMMEVGSLTPPRVELLLNPEWVKKFPAMKVMSELKNPVAFPKTGKFIKMQQLFFEQIPMALAGHKTSEKCIKDIAAEINKMLKSK